MKKPIKTVFIDLDDTLLNSEGIITPYTLSVLEECKRRGVYIVFATARSEISAKRYIDAVRPNGVISNCGAQVRIGDTIIHTQTLDKATSNALIAALLGCTALQVLTVETEGGYYLCHNGDLSTAYGFAERYDFTNPLDEAIYKATVYFHDISAAENIASRFDNVKLSPFSDKNWCAFMHIDSSKMNGAIKVIEHLGIDTSNTIAFGDDYNDIELLKHCGIGIAMENAILSVKAAADVICESNDDDGVAKWLEKHVL